MGHRYSSNKIRRSTETRFYKSLPVWNPETPPEAVDLGTSKARWKEVTTNGRRLSFEMTKVFKSQFRVVVVVQLCKYVKNH